MDKWNVSIFPMPQSVWSIRLLTILRKTVENTRTLQFKLPFLISKFCEWRILSVQSVAKIIHIFCPTPSCKTQNLSGSIYLLRVRYRAVSKKPNLCNPLCCLFRSLLQQVDLIARLMLLQYVCCMQCRSLLSYTIKNKIS